MATVLVGYVPKPEGEAALTRAIEEALLRKAQLLVISAHRNREGAAPDLTEVRAQLESSGVDYDLREVADGGDVADELVQNAVDSGAELLVIGLRRRTPVGKLILGSNAQRVLLDAPCPVLAVKG